MVVIDSKKGPKSRNYIEMLGSYNPRQKHIQVNADRIKHWIAQGAQTSDTVHNILVKEKVIEGKKINVLPKKSPVVKEEKKEDPSTSSSPEGRDSSRAGQEKDVSEEVSTEEVKTEGDAPADGAKAEDTPSEESKEEASAEEPAKEEPEKEPVEEKPAEEPVAETKDDKKEASE